MSHSGERKPLEDEQPEFPSVLQKLKQQGCSLLVVGKAPDSVYKAASRQMLGAATHLTRRRLFIATDRDVSTAQRLLSTLDPQLDPTTGKILSFDSESRQVAVQSEPPQTQVPVEHVEGSDLTTLGIAISETIAEFEEQELGPAELRVCLDSLTPLVERDRETLFQFLDLLNSRIRSVSGMAHMHLPVDRDSEIVHLLEPLFDVLIELRVKDNEPQQRWYITDQDVCSEWFTQE